jgi:hypothetical protein
MAVVNSFECNKCITVGSRYQIDAFPQDDLLKAQEMLDDPGDALDILNTGLKYLWSYLWLNFQCKSKLCGIKKACAGGFTEIEWGVTDIIVDDPALPLGNKIVWVYFVEAKREIKCVPYALSHDDPCEGVDDPFAELTALPKGPYKREQPKWAKEYYISGTRRTPDDREVNCDDCDKCTVITGQTTYFNPNAPFVTHDTDETWMQDSWKDPQVQLEIVNTCVLKLWNDMWNNFQCTGERCTKKKACGDRPTYLVIGIIQDKIPVPDTDDDGRKILWWRFVVVAQREIKCVLDDGVPEVDIPFREYETLPEKSPYSDDEEPEDLFV